MQHLGNAIDPRLVESLPDIRVDVRDINFTHNRFALQDSSVAPVRYDLLQYLWTCDLFSNFTSDSNINKCAIVA